MWAAANDSTACRITLGAAHSREAKVTPSWRRSHLDFEIDIFLAPQKRYPHQPIFSPEGVASAREVFARQEASRGRKFRSRDLAAHRTGSDSNLGIVADTLGFSGVAAGHDVEFAIGFPKPDWGGDRLTGFSEGGERNVFVALNFRRNGHRDIVPKGCRMDFHIPAGWLPAHSILSCIFAGVILNGAVCPAREQSFADRLLRQKHPDGLCSRKPERAAAVGGTCPSPDIARDPVPVLQAKHA
jgi:hypothetical protein